MPLSLYYNYHQTLTISLIKNINLSKILQHNNNLLILNTKSIKKYYNYILKKKTN